MFFFFEPDETASISHYVKENCPEDVAEVIKKADETAENTFIFNCRWDLESTFFPVKFQISGGAQSDARINWLYQPKDDPEWTYALNRMRYWICLGQAYAITGDEKYPQTFVRQLTDWVENVKLTDSESSPAWRTIEAGFRLEYWIKAWQYMKFSPSVTDKVREIFFNSVAEHADYIVRSYNDFNRISNWGVLANHGLFMVGVLLENKQYVSTALKRLEAEARTQIYPDGMQWEQSPMYHNEVLHDFLDVLILAGRNDFSEAEYPEITYIKETTYRMCVACSVFQKPDHHQIMMGDSDDLDVSWNLARGAYYFHDSKLKARSIPQFDFDTIWDTGYKAALEYADMAVNDGGELSTVLQTSGNAFFRSSWKEDAAFLHFHCGTMGAGHGHSDQLHVDFSANGEDILVDSGRFTYVSKRERYDYKNPPAHNTITVDGVDYCHWTDSWGADSFCKPINFKSVSVDGYCYCEGGHTGYLVANDVTGCKGGVLVNRRVLFIKPDIVLFVDEFISTNNVENSLAGSADSHATLATASELADLAANPDETRNLHTYRQYFHFSDTGDISRFESVDSCGMRNHAGEDSASKENSGTHANYPRFLFRGKKTCAGLYTCGEEISADIFTMKVSRHYNSFAPNKTVCVSAVSAGFKCIPTALFVGKTEDEVSGANCSFSAVPVYAAIKGTDLPPEKVEAWNIKKDGRFYTVVAAHQEFAAPTEMFSADGCTGFASFMVFDRISGKYTLVC